MARWLSALQDKLEKHSVGSHPDFRVFISAEPAATADSHIIPQGILENSIKITNEPPTGMHSNLHKAFDNFNQVKYYAFAVVFVVVFLLDFLNYSYKSFCEARFQILVGTTIIYSEWVKWRINTVTQFVIFRCSLIL